MTKWGSRWPCTQPRSSHPRMTPTCTSRGHLQRHKSPCYSQPVPPHIILYPPPHGLSRAKFLNNVYQGVLQNFPRGSVWTLALWMDGSGLVLQLARAKLHPPNRMTSCAKAGTATDYYCISHCLFPNFVMRTISFYIHSCPTPHICCRHLTLN